MLLARLKGALLPGLCLLLQAAVSHAFTEPFSTHAAYDAHFKEPAAYSGLSRSNSNYLILPPANTGIAIYDSSASGGTNGSGGTGGADANIYNDVALSAAFYSSSSSGVGMGFFFGLDNTENSGYLVSVRIVNSTTIRLEVNRNAGVNTPGINVYSTTISWSSTPFSTFNYYAFKVLRSGATFKIDFGNGAATATFTDSSPLLAAGQVGILMDNQGSGQINLDDFSISSAAEVSTIWKGPNNINTWNESWSEPTNWTTHVPQNGDVLLFQSPLGYPSAYNDLTSLTVKSLLFSVDAPSYGMNGDVTVSDEISNLSGKLQMFLDPVRLSGAAFKVVNLTGSSTLFRDLIISAPEITLDLSSSNRGFLVMNHLINGSGGSQTLNFQGLVPGATLTLGQYLMGAGTHTLNGGILSFNGIKDGGLSSPGSLILNASASFSSTSTYRGSTTLKSGKSLFAGNGSLSPYSAILLEQGAKLFLNGTNSIPSLSGEGQVFSNSASLSTLQIGSGNSDSTFKGTVLNDSSYTPARTILLEKIGSGTLTLEGLNSHTGGTRITEGTLALVNGGRLGGTTVPLTVADGTLDLGGSTQTVGPISLNGHATLTGGGIIYAQSLTITGTGNVITPGTVVIVNSHSTLTGDLTNEGTLRLMQNADISGSGNLLNEGTFDIISGSQTLPPGFINTGVVLDSSNVKILSSGFDDTNYLLSIQTYPGHTYRLEHKISLTDAQWLEAAEAAAVTDPQGVLTFTVPGTTASYNKRFFRIHIDP